MYSVMYVIDKMLDILRNRKILHQKRYSQLLELVDKYFKAAIVRVQEFKEKGVHHNRVSQCRNQKLF